MLLCCMCHEWKPVADFAFRSKKTGKRQSQCRMCQAKYRRQHYLRTKATYLENERRRMRGRRHRNRTLILDYLLAHPCVDCGEADPVVLEFDHRDRSCKRLDVPKLAAKKPWKVVEAEIAKCDVRCVNCHRHRTAVQFNWRRVRAQPVATQSQARLEALPHAALEALSTLERTRVCRDCGRQLPLTEFAIKNASRGTFATKCRACQRTYARAHYANNKQTYLERTSRRNRATRDLVAAWLLGYLTDHGCVDCGTNDSVVLEFDHPERSSKVAAVATLARRRSWGALFREVAKCEVRCANCHRRRTARQFGDIRLTGDPDAA